MQRISKSLTYLLFLILLIACDSQTAEKKTPDSGPAPNPNSKTAEVNTGNPTHEGEEEEVNEENTDDTGEAFVSLMLEFKSVLIDEMISPKWTKISEWEEACGSATNLKDQAKLLMTLESGVVWNAVSPKWKERRAAWMKSCESASSAKDLGRLLTELETNISWESVDKSWRHRRDGWLKECTAL